MTEASYVAGAGLQIETVEPLRRQTPLYRRLLHSRSAVIGLAITLVLLMVAVAAPLIAPYSPIEQSFRNQLQPPSLQHLLGTDEFGRDIFSRVLHGARWALMVGLLADGIALVLGVGLGLLGGFYGGRVDAAITWLTDVTLAFPYLLLAMMIVAVLGPGITNAMIAIGIVYMPKYTRLVRGTVLSLREKEFVEAAHAIGVPALSGHPAAHPAQLHGADHRDGHPGHRLGDRGNGRAVVPGPRRTAADPGMGSHALLGPDVHALCLVDCDLPGAGHPGHGDRLQSAWRRAARCA